MESAELVSFDVFDTLLLRKVLKPTDVFRRMERELGAGARGFCGWRVEAEHTARQEAPASFANEVTLEEIYTVLCRSHAQFKDRRSELMAHELQIESDVTIMHPLGHALFGRARDLGRRIVLLSDMYLPQSAIEALLRSHGYAGGFDLFLSNVHRQSKSQGALFQTVIEQLGVGPERILHLGDNLHADYKMARKAGWHAIHIPKLSATLKPSCLDCSLAESILEALRLRRVAEDLLMPDHSRDFWQRVGESVAAPVYLGFITHLMEQTKELGAHRLFFCSRDGKIMKAVYDLLTAGREDYPKSQYFLSSRRASKMAAFEKLGDMELNFLMDAGLDLTIRDYLNRIHIEPESVEHIVLSCGFEGLDETVIEPMECRPLRELFLALEPQILEIAAEEREAYFEYMDSVGMLDEDVVALVDVGWNATIFGAMTKLVRKRRPNCQMAGFFFGTFEWAFLNKHENASLDGYFFEDCAPDENYRALKHSIAICELLFSAEEGSLLRFKKEGGQIRPEFEPELPSLAHSTAVRGIQEGALAVLREYTQASGQMYLSIEQKAATAPFVRMLTRPTVEEARAWGDLPFWPEFGLQTRDHFLARPSSLYRYLLRPYFMKGEYRKCYWRAGFYRRLPLVHRMVLWCICPDLKFAYKAS